MNENTATALFSSKIYSYFLTVFGPGSKKNKGNLHGHPVLVSGLFFKKTCCKRVIPGKKADLQHAQVFHCG
ncbi:hypothetical protein [Rufibacter roseolus]|uniref:hypothetical protein n=1 Tax=Rufibacter roseolus TaxID=2817375 RepID=UPI001B30BA63|nr:hypothetical protein [Rufibacter roseolus]